MTPVIKEKINGVSFVAHRDSISQKNVDPLLNINANYAAIMPFAMIKSLDRPNVNYDAERQWFGETIEGGKQYINTLKDFVFLSYRTGKGKHDRNSL